MIHKKISLATIVLVISLTTIYLIITRININTDSSVGEVVDSYNGVEVYYNGGVDQTFGRNVSKDGYNIGIRYQCVEFIKRYYYQRFLHKMPDAFGHAKDYFDNSLQDGQLNIKRNLLQYKNNGKTMPEPEDIIVFSPWIFNRYGHVAIITKVEGNKVEVIQQNPGPFASSRETFDLSFNDNRWKIEHGRALGWLRLTNKLKMDNNAVR